MAKYPVALYHTAVRRPRNAFGHLVDRAEPVHVGDDMNPGYHIPLADAHAINRGIVVGDQHFIPKHHYRTMVCAVYAAGQIDEKASAEQEKKFLAEGWVRNPSDLKEEYEDTDK